MAITLDVWLYPYLRNKNKRSTSTLEKKFSD